MIVLGIEGARMLCPRAGVRSSRWNEGCSRSWRQENVPPILAGAESSPATSSLQLHYDLKQLSGTFQGIWSPILIWFSRESQVQVTRKWFTNALLGHSLPSVGDRPFLGLPCHQCLEILAGLQATLCLSLGTLLWAGCYVWHLLNNTTSPLI